MSNEMKYFDHALASAKYAKCIRRKYGACIVKNDEIVSTGYNGSPREVMNCTDINKCARKEKNIKPGERYEECLTGDTKILLLDGSYKTIEEIFNMKCVYMNLYSYDIGTKNLVQTFGENIRLTKFVDELIQITLSDNSVIRCTSDHRFLIYDYPLFLKAKDLLPNTRIRTAEITSGEFQQDFIKVKDIDIVEVENEPLYDISVPDYENFAIVLNNSDNIVFAHNCHSVHAEANAIISASRSEMIDSTLYLIGLDAETNEITEYNKPCSMCRRMIINAGIKEVKTLNFDNSVTVISRADLIEEENKTFDY
jgi:deoxycytidylate deaminase